MLLHVLLETTLNLRVYEDVVNVQLAHLDVRNRGRVTTWVVIKGSVTNMLKDLVGIGQGNVNKTLTVGDRH
jgi:hypothetical protein